MVATVGQRMKELRLSLKLSQDQFGKKLAISRDVIANIENERTESKDDFIELICNIFDVNKSWLTNGAGAMFSGNTQKQGNHQSVIRTKYTHSPFPRSCC